LLHQLALVGFCFPSFVLLLPAGRWRSEQKPDTAVLTDSGQLLAAKSVDDARSADAAAHRNQAGLVIHHFTDNTSLFSQRMSPHNPKRLFRFTSGDEADKPPFIRHIQRIES
jgi:hypothetical protein